MDHQMSPWTKFIQKGNESQPSGQIKLGSQTETDSKVKEPDNLVPSQSLNSNTICIKGDNKIELIVEI